MKAIPQHSLDTLDSWLTLRQKWAQVPGFAVSIVQDGKVIFDKAYGYANQDTKEPLTTDHVFRIASQSKTFTATALMQLVEQGKIGLEDTVASHLDWLMSHEDPRWQDVTVRQVLSHSAGIIRDGEDSNYWSLSRPFPSAEELQRDFMSTKLVKDPNTKMKYTNYGFSLLGLLIEKASGQMYDAYIHEHIIDPLGLASISTDLVVDAQNVALHSRLAIDNTRHTLPNVSANAMAAATGFSASMRDIAKYFSAHKVGSELLLKDTSKREMQRRHAQVMGMPDKWYGLGFEHYTIGEHRFIGHGGGFPGTVTRSIVDPIDGFTISIAINTQAASGDLSKGIVTLLDSLGYAAPDTKILKFEGRFADMWSTYQVVATADGLRGYWPNSWFGFEEYETLAVIDDTTLRISKSDGFASEGERITYTFNDDGSIKSVVNAGFDTPPSDDGEIPITWE